jgi:transposase
MSKKIAVAHERVDDLPILIRQLKHMRVAELLDEHIPTNGNWQGLSLGWVVVVWLTFILSEGDHRLSHVEPWVNAHKNTLRRCLSRWLKPRDFNDDRLATVLDYLAVTENWVAFERALNQQVLRVYDLRPQLARVDTTTTAAFVTPEGLFQLGHSKDHRPDLPQLKIAFSSLDPFGLPLTVAVVAGNTADDPLYLPEIHKIRQIAQITGLTYVGDSKMAALATRAAIVARQDHYLCPLSAKQISEAALDQLLAPVFNGTLVPTDIYLPAESDETASAEPVAVGFEYVVTQHGVTPDGPTLPWQERRLVVRSLAYAAAQERHFRARVERAVNEINALSERKQGKPVLTDAAAAQAAADALLEKHRVAAVVTVTVTATTQERTKRGYGGRPATTTSQTQVQLSAAVNEAALTQALARLGWRVYATSHRADELSLTQAVAAYRDEYLIEQNFGRLKGRALSLRPLYLQFEERACGLIYLLSIGLRVLVLVQFVVRRSLQQTGTKLKGLYPGQPGRQTAQPTTELLLRAFRGLTLSHVRVAGAKHLHLTPLNAVQKRILKLLEMPQSIYTELTT